MKPGRLAALWVLSRLATALLFLGFEGQMGVAGDVKYFSASLDRIALVGPAHTLPEYPLPAVAVLALPKMIVGTPGPMGYGLALMTLVLVVDGLFMVLLVRRPGPGRVSSLRFWLAAGPLSGGIFLDRLDLLVGVTVAVSLLVVSSRPRVAGAALALAVAIKLWPALLAPVLLGSTRHRAGVLKAFAAVGLSAATMTYAVGGWSRVVSPLTYQVHRGLQIEALSATPAMVGRGVDPSRWTLLYSAYKAVEVRGPGVHALLGLSVVLSVLVLVGLSALTWRLTARAGVAGARGDLATSRALVWVSLAVAAGYVVAGKVFSPQYLLWLLPLVAVSLTMAPGPELRRWAAGLLCVTALSQLIYPLLYHELVADTAATPPSVAVLVVRNLLMVWLAVLAAQQAWRVTRAPAGTVRFAPPRPAQESKDR